MQEARVKAAEAKVKEIEERGAEKAREEAKARGLALPEDFNDDPPTSTDKLVSALPYILPLMDSLVFGAHIFNLFPSQVRGGGSRRREGFGMGTGAGVYSCHAWP